MHNRTAPLTALKSSGCTNFKLRQLLRRVSQQYDAELAKAGLKTTQYSLLSHVLKLGPIRPGRTGQGHDDGRVHAHAQPPTAASRPAGSNSPPAPTRAAGRS